MKCPKCNALVDKVIDSRETQDGDVIRRRRECMSCHFRFTTIEGVIPEELKVIKRNGEKEDFCRDKLRSGISRACYKRVLPEKIDEIVDKIVREIQRSFDNTVPSSEIGAITMAALREVDAVAYVRFASVYRNFQEVKDFIHEIKEMKK